MKGLSEKDELEIQPSHSFRIVISKILDDRPTSSFGHPNSEGH